MLFGKRTICYNIPAKSDRFLHKIGLPLYNRGSFKVMGGVSS